MSSRRRNKKGLRTLPWGTPEELVKDGDLQESYTGLSKLIQYQADEKSSLCYVGTVRVRLERMTRMLSSRAS